MFNEDKQKKDEIEFKIKKSNLEREVKKMRLSIVIPTRRPENLKDCLYFIKKYTKDYETQMMLRRFLYHRIHAKIQVPA
mgnify:CR=1 FL=1